MGFFTQLGDIWSDWSKEKSWDLLGESWGKTKDSAKAFASGFWGLASAPFTDKTMAQAYFDWQFNQKNTALESGFGALASLAGGVAEAPGVRQILGTAGWLQNELIKRPMGAAYLMTGDVARGKTSYSDMGAWRRAYNDTRTVSTGQAAVYSGAGGLPFLQMDPEGDLDPRKRQEAYHNNALLKYSSGTMDMAVDVFADPTVIGGKAMAAAKLRYISQPLKAAADVKRYIDSPSYAKLHEFIKAAPNPEYVRQRVFAGHYSGDKAAAVLWSVREDDVLYDHTFNALTGNLQSWDYLVDNAPRIAELTGRMYANQTIARAADLTGTNGAADAMVDALRETETQAFVDAIANEKGIWGEVPGLLANQHAPRLTLTSKWRAGVHNWATFGPATFRGSAIYPLVSRGRYALPTAKFTRFLDVNDVNSAPAFRSNLERAPFDRARVEHWTSLYGRASTAESRARIASAAEDEGFKLLAVKHGWTEADVNGVLPQINKWRSGNRRVFSTSRRYLSATARELAEKYITAGRLQESDNAFFLAEDIDAAVRRGDQPSSHHVILDEDGNNVLIPGRFQIDPTKPVAVSQNAEMMPMVDWRVLDTALAWARKGPLGVKAYNVINAGGALLDVVNSVWKVTALLRPGYVWRMLSDDVMRRGTLYGTARVMMSTGRGIANSGRNWAGRYGMVRDRTWADRSRRGLNSTERIDADLVDHGEALAPMYRQPLGGPREPDDLAVKLSAAPGSRLREAIELISGRDNFTKQTLRRELNMGDKVANQMISEMESRGIIETVSTKGKVTYRRATFDPQDLGLMYQPLDYGTYDSALADGVLSVGDYLRAIESHAERGDLPGELAMLLQGRRDGTLDEAATIDRTYQRQVIDRALRSVGRGAYSRPDWQQGFVEMLIDRHLDRDIGQVGSPTVVDPMTGMELVFDGPIDPHTFTLSKGASVLPNANGFYDYVADNIDALLMPRNLLHAYIAPDGRMRLSVARYDGVETRPVKPTGGKRVKLFKAEGSKPHSFGGADRIEINTAAGPIVLQSAFEGAEGARFAAQASSRGPSDAWADQVSDTEYARLMNESHGQKDVSPDEPHYQVTWERAVNVQLYNDAVARMFMAGKTENDVLNWLHNTTEGRSYWGKLGPWQSRPVEQVLTVKAMVDTYLPDNGDAASASLRRAALEGKAEFRQFDKLFTSKEEMPAVHGASLDVAIGGPFTNMVKRGVDKIFKVFSDLPADTASRFPFFADRYEAHTRALAPIYAEQYAKHGEWMPSEAVGRIERQARQRALADVKKYLYDTSAALDMAAAGRLFVPFSSAVGDSFLKWGVIAREKGVIPPVLNIWKIWTAPDRAGLIQDEDGNVKRQEDGKDVWYGVNPKTGQMSRLDNHEAKQEFIVFQLPSGIAPKSSSGAVMPSYINKETFNTFLGLPTAGPLVSYPVNEFSLKNPKLAENWFVRKFVLPFGPTSSDFKALVPSNVRSTYWFLTEREEGFRGTAQAVMQTEYTRYALGLRDKPPTMAEVQASALDMEGLKWLSSFMGVSQQFKSPYQPYVDYYRMLQQTDPENATGRFYSEMGEEFKMMTASVSRNVAGLPASIQTAKQQERFKDLIAKFPDLAPLIVGAEGAGRFSSAVYQAQLEQVLQPGSNEKMREILSLQDSVEDAERRYVWYKYGQLMDAIDADMKQRGLTSLSQNRAKDLKALKDKFVAAHQYWTNPQGARDVNPWFQDYSTTDRARMTKRLTGMAQLVMDERIGQRDDMRGLFEYLNARIQVRAEMQRRKFATLDSNKARTLRLQWESYVQSLKDDNLAFADLHNRWLANDDLAADILFEEGGA